MDKPVVTMYSIGFCFYVHKKIVLRTILTYKLRKEKGYNLLQPVKKKQTFFRRNKKIQEKKTKFI